MNKVNKIKDTSGEVSLENESTEIIPQANQIIKPDAEIDAFIEVRKAFITKVSAICVEGKDYHVIQGKKSLAKGGAEKIASIFHWTAKFDKDTEALEMLGAPAGLVAFKCTLNAEPYSTQALTSSSSGLFGKYIGEGRGAATLQKNSSDPNKTLKMAQKSAFIDAVLRASGLSDFFTQDLEDMPREQISQPQYTHGGELVEKSVQKSIPPSEKQLNLIGTLCKQKGYTKEDIMDQGFSKLTGGKDGTASELINWLFKAPTKVTSNSVELPTIQTEDPISEEEQALIDSIPF